MRDAAAPSCGRTDVPGLSLIDRLAQGPVIEPGTPAYIRSREMMRVNAAELKRLRELPVDAFSCSHAELPGLFLSSLLDPMLARKLRGRAVGYEVVLADTWDKLLDLHPLWCPPYVRFVEGFRDAEALLCPCAADTLDRLIREGSNPLRAVTLSVMRSDVAKPALRSYVARVRAVDLKVATEEALFRDNVDELGRCLAARALLFAVVGLPDARDLVAHSIADVIATVESLCGEGERAECTINCILHADRSFRIWGLVHTLVDLGQTWETHFAPWVGGILANPLRLPADLAIPEIGGAAFADLCRATCDEVARWYLSDEERTDIGGAGLACEPATESASCGKRPSNRCRPELPADPSAYVVDCERMALLCRGTPISLPPVAWNFIQRLAYERSGLVPCEEVISGEGAGRSTARDGRREFGRTVGIAVANALVVTERRRGYRLKMGAGGVKVHGLGEAGLVFGHEER